MARTLVRQSSQIRNSDLFDDTLAAGATLESGSTSVESDLNGLRAQIRRLQGGANWYEALAGRSVTGLETDLSDLELKPVLFRSQILTDIAVGAGENFVILSQAGGQAPSQVSAVGAATTEGAVVAFNATFGAHTLDLVTGLNALSPRNLVIVRNADTSDPILSGGKVVYGLLQSEDATNGVAFDDVANRVQISFVRENAAGTALEAVPFADIESQNINYAYTLRVFLDNLPQDAFLGGAFVDQAASINPDLQIVIDAQGNTAVTSLNATDITFGASTYGWTFNTDGGGSTAFGLADGFKNVVGSGESHTVSLAGIARSMIVDDGAGTPYYELSSGFGSGGIVTYNVSDWSVTHNTAATFSGEVRAGIANNYVSLGALGEARVESEGGSDLIVKGSVELLLDDSYKDSSSWGGAVNGVPLADSIGEWTAYADFSLNGSILSAIVKAGTTVSREKATVVVTADIAADTDLQDTVNIDGALPGFTALSFVTGVDVYLNGQLMRGGANAAANFDVYPGADPSVGEIRFEFGLTAGDVVTVVRYGAL